MRGPIGEHGTYGLATPIPYISTAASGDGEPMAEAGRRAVGDGYGGAILFSSIDEKGAISNHPDALDQAFRLGQRATGG